MTSSEDCVRYSAADGVARIRLGRPPVNALTPDMIRALLAALRRAATDDAVRAVVLTSAVQLQFCAGLDLARVIGSSRDEVRALLQALYVEMHDAQSCLGKPSIAAVGGAARGGGMTLAISCDVMIAGQSATFGYPEINIGVLPAIHFIHLPGIVGRHRAFELLFSGRTFDAQEAFGLGLVSKVVADGHVEAAALALAAEFAGKPEAAMRLGRAAFRRQNDRDYQRGLADAVESFCDIVMTQAAQDHIRAFLDKHAAGHRSPLSDSNR